MELSGARGPCCLGFSALAILVLGCPPVESPAERSKSTRPEAAIETGAEQPIAEALEVDWAGCADVIGPVADPTCELFPDGLGLKIWVRGRHGSEIRFVRGSRLVSDPEPARDGHLFAVEVLPGAGRLELTAGAGADAKTWSLKLSHASPPPVLDVITALPDTDAGWSEARERLDTALLESHSELERARLVQRLAAVEHAIANDLHRSAELFAEAARLFERQGRIRGQIDALTRRHFLLYSELGNPVEAGRALDALPIPPAGDATSALIIDVYRAPWKIRLGRLRTALRALQAAEVRAERLDHGLLFYTRQPQSFLSSRLGLYGDAQKLDARLRQTSGRLDACQKSDLFNDLGWSRILRLEALGHGSAGWQRDAAAPDALVPRDPTPDLLEAHRLAAECRSRRGAFRRVNTILNLALAHLHFGRVEEARQVFDRLDSEETSRLPILDGWRLELEGRIALAAGRAEDALRAYGALGKRAAERLDGAERWRALVGRAMALDALGRGDEALRAFAEAEDLLDSSEVRVPFLEEDGPESAFVFFERGSRHHLDLLLRLGRGDEALALARRSRNRALGHLDRSQRVDEGDATEWARWKELRADFFRSRARIETLVAKKRRMPLDAHATIAAERQRLELEQEKILAEIFAALGGPRFAGADRNRPPEGELVLIYHPLPRGLVGFAADGRGVLASRLESEILIEPQPTSGARGAESRQERLSRALLAPFADAIRKAERIRILPHGSLWQVGFHALPFDGGILLDRAPVVYGLDLGGPGDGSDLSETAAAEPRRAVVVSDPTHSLPRAADEARQVAGSLERVGGWRVERLEADRATPSAVRSMLERQPVDLFHFAGHIDAEGNTRLDIGLLFDDELRLGIADILTLERAPSIAVLSSCRAIDVDGRTAATRLGPAQAFLLAGSRAVVGPTNPVDDRQAAALMQLFYRFRAETGPAEALRRAQLLSRERSPDAWGSSFRLIER